MARFFLLLLFFLAGAGARAETAVDAFTHLEAGEYAKAFEIADPLAQAGDADAMHLTGFLYENGLGVERDMARAVALYAAAGAKGQPDAQFALGELSLTGEGVKQDAVTAAGWYRLAAKQGHARAKLRLGVMHMQGDGVETDKAQAMRLFREAADGGEAEAMRNLAIAYMSGDGVPKNQRIAGEWFEKGVAAGDPVSAYNYGLMLQSGVLGVPDLEAAAEHMRAAADIGFAPAMTALGLLIHGGAEAGESPADWFERAARAGDAQGRFLYAVALTEGDGRERDDASALLLLDDLLADETAPPELQAQAKKLKARVMRRQGKQ